MKAIAKIMVNEKNLPAVPVESSVSTPHDTATPVLS